MFDTAEGIPTALAPAGATSRSRRNPRIKPYSRATTGWQHSTFGATVEADPVESNSQIFETGATRLLHLGRGSALAASAWWSGGKQHFSAALALLIVDAVYGFLPPHPANPPTKRPLVALMKQARAFGVRMVVATQNPMDLDYRALSNAGVWCIGRLQTDADRARVLDGWQARRRRTR